MKRFLILTGDSELAIRLEVAYQLRHILKEIDEGLIQKKFYKILENYINDDDMVVKSETIISILLNIDKFITDLDQEFIEEFVKTIHYLFEVDYLTSERFKFVKKVFDCLVKKIYDNSITSKDFHNLVKIYLKKYFLNYDNYSNNSLLSLSSGNSQIIYSYNNIIENFHLIATNLKNFGENNLFTDLFTYLVKQVTESTNEEKSHIEIFYEHLDKVK